MLVKCPECELQVSSNAVTCPHCGYPLKPMRNSRPRATSNKRRRLPNGFGQISEIKGRNLRKPFRAMVTVGKTESGRPICKPLKPVSYFATYNDAYLALAEYNKNPYDADKDITMQELYERWSAEYYNKDMTDTWRNALESAWESCGKLHNVPVREIKSLHLKNCLCESGLAANKAHTAKTVLNKMFDYAMEYDLVDRNYARMFSVKKEEPKQEGAHIIYTDDELKKLWRNIDTIPMVDMLLIQCYSGWRPQELCDLLVTNVDLENG
ncbi:MAG: zinc ribbon domain-containing protein [Clostridiales bacterium]|nr:zinc ribbon domain-containing protein [Clostridiales bacterium]